MRTIYLILTTLLIISLGVLEVVAARSVSMVPRTDTRFGK